MTKNRKRTPPEDTSDLIGDAAQEARIDRAAPPKVRSALEQMRNAPYAKYAGPDHVIQQIRTEANKWYCSNHDADRRLKIITKICDEYLSRELADGED